MATFKYVAQRETGGRRSGVLAAQDSADAFRRLRADGLRPVKIEAVHAGPAVKSAARWKTEDLIDLIDDLSVMLSAGIGLAAALDIAQDSLAKSKISDLVKMLRAHVQEGAGLDSAFESAGDRDALVIAGAIAAGQAAGRLPEALAQVSAILKVRLKARDDLVAAAAYPAFLALFAFVLLIVLFVGVLPTFEPILLSADMHPSGVIGVLFMTSDVIRHYGLIALAALGAAAMLIMVVGGSGLMRRVTDAAALEGLFASVGRPMVFGAAASFLGMLLSASVPAADALRAAAASCQNTIARARMEQAARRVREGAGVAEALAGVRGFPRALSRMAGIGEAAGVLGPLLTRGGETEQARAVKAIAAFTRAAGPLLVMVMGGLIGSIMIAVFLAINSMGEAALR